jgi:hypothetical protein
LTQSLSGTTRLAPTGVEVGGRKRLTRLSLRTAVGTTLYPRRHPHDDRIGSHSCLPGIWQPGEHDPNSAGLADVDHGTVLWVRDGAAEYLMGNGRDVGRRAPFVRLVASAPRAAEELRQPLLLAVCFGFRLDCLEAPLVHSALRATIGPRPDAAPRALTAGLFFSRSFFNRLDWHSHSRPPRFASPIVALMSSQINPDLLRMRRGSHHPVRPRQ